MNQNYTKIFKLKNFQDSIFQFHFFPLIICRQFAHPRCQRRRYSTCCWKQAENRNAIQWARAKFLCETWKSWWHFEKSGRTWFECSAETMAAWIANTIACQWFGTFVLSNSRCEAWIFYIFLFWLPSNDRVHSIFRNRNFLNINYNMDPLNHSRYSGARSIQGDVYSVFAVTTRESKYTACVPTIFKTCDRESAIQ